MTCLLKKAMVMNLTAITDFDEVIEKHFPWIACFSCNTLDLNAEKMYH